MMGRAVSAAIRGLFQIVSPLIGAGKRPVLQVGLVSYLDDSGTDAENPLVTMAGYIGTVDAWRAFETEAAAIKSDFGVTDLHGKELHDGGGDFKGWPVAKKCEFLRRINEALAPRVGLAVSFATLKGSFRERQAGHPTVQSPYGFCFTGILDLLLRDESFLAVIERPGVTISFVIEEGNKNNQEILQRYQRVKKRHPGKLKFLSGMVFAAKGSSIAIEAADLFAFLTRRHAVAMESGGRIPIEPSPYLSILRANIRDIGFAATDFAHVAPSS